MEGWKEKKERKGTDYFVSLSFFYFVFYFCSFPLFPSFLPSVHPFTLLFLPSFFPSTPPYLPSFFPGYLSSSLPPSFLLSVSPFIHSFLSSFIRSSLPFLFFFFIIILFFPLLQHQMPGNATMATQGKIWPRKAIDVKTGT